MVWGAIGLIRPIRLIRPITFRPQLAGSLALWVLGAAQEGFACVGAGFCGSLDHRAVAFGAGGQGVVFGGGVLLPVFQAFGSQSFRVASFFYKLFFERFNLLVQ